MSTKRPKAPTIATAGATVVKNAGYLEAATPSPRRRPSKRDMLDRAIGRAVALFNDLLSEAKRGHYVDAIRLQRDLNDDLKEGR